MSVISPPPIHSTVIFFDLETAGWHESEIVSIGAIAVKREDGSEFAADGISRFQVCILPNMDIDPGASKVNGFTKQNGGTNLIAVPNVYSDTFLFPFLVTDT